MRFKTYLGKFLACLAAFSIAGCGKTQEPPHNAQYYRSHPEERAAMMKSCAADQNTENPMNCMAAENANRLEVLSRSH